MARIAAEVTVERDWDPDDPVQAMSMSLVSADAVADAKASIEALPLKESALLVISTRFDDTVRERVDDPHGLFADYTYLRPLEFAAGAKVILDKDRGIYSIVVHAEMFHDDEEARDDRERRRMDVPRMILHEGWHVVLLQRGENPMEQADRLKPDEGSTHYDVAAFICDEFRIERKLCADGLFNRNRPRIAFYFEARAELRQAPKIGRGHEDFFKGALGLCQTYGARFAAVAAESVVRGRHVDDRRSGSRAWTEAGLVYWKNILEILKDVPGAEKRYEEEDRDRSYLLVVEQVGEWMTMISEWAPGLPAPVLDKKPDSSTGDSNA